MGIFELNQLSTERFKEHYLTSDHFTLESKSSSFMGRIFQWLKKAFNPKIYKAENIFKNLITYAAFTRSTEKTVYKVNLKDEKFQDWTLRLEKADQNRILLPKQNQMALKIYRAALEALQINLSHFLDVKNPAKGKLKTALISEKSLNPALKVVLVALKAQGYNDEFCQNFLTLAASTNSSFKELLNNLENNSENILHLFNLIESLAQAHRESKASPTFYPCSKGLISKTFNPYIESRAERLRNDYQDDYYFVDNNTFRIGLFELLKTADAPSA